LQDGNRSLRGVNDCLLLPFRQGPGAQLGSWEATWFPLGEGEAEGLPAGKGRGWEPVEVPAQLAASEDRQAVWYRTMFARPDHDGRVLLRFGGAFLAANVWLNGRLLGSHYGYFGPFGFDITPYLKPENLLVVCCESPIELDLARKRHVMGVFNDGDTRPYPASAFFSLPEPFRWEVPVGLWREVELEYAGSVVVDALRLRPRLEAGVGRLEVEARLRNLHAREMTGELALEVDGPEVGEVRLRREFRVQGGMERTLAITLSLPGALRWSPWRFGEQHLYDAALTLEIEGTRSAAVGDRFGFRELEVREGPEGWSIRLNGHPMFLRGAGYTPAYRLDTLRPEIFESDLARARAANLDALRVHGHVLPEDFYRAADEAGMLVVADFPLTLAYAYHARAEESRFFEDACRSQVPEMVELLRNRPSIAFWMAHDDPPWIAASSALSDVHTVRQNYTIDQELKALFEKLDPSRTAVAASGENDPHLYLGWRTGGWQDFAAADAALVTEFGAQSLPSVSSPVWQEIGRRWPVADDEPRWLHAGFEVPAWAEHGVGLPSAQSSFKDYVEQSQAYQAFLLRHAVDQLRKRKFERCWGAFWYQLVDAFPAIGFSVLDAARVEKAAYRALAEAMAPTRAIIDPIGYVACPGWAVGFRQGASVAFRIVVVNDDPALQGPASLRWSAWRESAPDRTGLQRLREAVRRKSFSGSVDFELPTAREPAAQVTSLSLPIAAEGAYRIEAELIVDGRAVDLAELDFVVAPNLEARRTLPSMPAFLAERLVDAGSLRAEPDGFSLALLNRTRPAALTRLDQLRLDGSPPRAPRVSVATASGRSPLPRRLDLPVGRPIRLHFELDAGLGEGKHLVELDLGVPGVASGTVRIEGVVEPEDLAPKPR
jgi:beta-mannosidase